MSATLQLLVQLPDDLKQFYSETGYVHTTANEVRSNARLRVRRQGLLTIVRTPPGLAENNSLHSSASGLTLIKDLSRVGVGLLYHEQLYPEEQIELQFQGREMGIHIVRCRRIGSRCYEIGGKVDYTLNLAADDN